MAACFADVNEGACGRSPSHAVTRAPSGSRDRRPPAAGSQNPFSSDSQIYAEHLLERFRLFRPSRLVGVGNYTLILMLVGIIAIAVGDELAIAHPHDPTIA